MVTDISFILGQLESVGVFDFLLPFLLVFALVYGILTATNMLGHNRGVSVVIALVVGLMSIRLGFMQVFMTQMFPRLGIGLTILLSILILVGLFIPKKNMLYWSWGLGAIGAVVAIVIMVQSFSQTGMMGVGYWEDYVGYIIGAVLLVGVIIAVAVSGGKKNGSSGSDDSRQGEAEFTLWRKRDDEE